MPRDHSPRLLDFARDLRQRRTDAEAKLWSRLRNRRLAGFKFRRQHPITGYILDFDCEDARLAVELDGGQHSDPATAEYDQRRTEKLSHLGIRVLRFRDHDVPKDTQIVAEIIYKHLSGEEPSPQPSPGVPGEGERRVSSP